ncbi:tetratricopeptide repeat protein [Stigmatella aurantiaca]|uniref:Tetratricopeptide repeat domain protein n=2 Tax=Stigmatella aurantiaca (strain DW4/3-1) TaxID=378806 RepID=E3FN62_STIAD|nr:tetratricopeptide repeat protein [Stigmatella aurantiaca]ADO74350.1 Tetratricopeptide repeat domain protein [Stigmatella aurantiaca DW4/3-1]
MTLALAFATAALLAAEPTSLPPNHPPVPPGTGASPAAPMGAMPEGHPPFAAPSAPGELPAGHPPMSETGRAPPSAEELLKQLDSTEGLRAREKTFEIASSLGKLYYSNGRHADSVMYFLQAEEKAVKTRALFLEQRKKLAKKPVPSAQEAQCGFSETSSVEEMGKVAEARAKQGDAAGAAACARAALAPVLEVEVLRANALYLTGDSQGALTVYGRVLEVSPSHEEALFSRSALLYETKGEDVKALQAAHEGFEAFLAMHPDSPRADLAKQLGQFAQDTAKAGGRQKWKQARAEDRRIRLSQPVAQRPMEAMPPRAAAGPDAPPALTQEMVDAVQNTERTPELEAGLAKLVEEGEEHLARGRYDDALAAYRRVVPFQPDNGRAKAGMAWALVGLGRPMADRIWGVAVGTDAAAVEKLGDSLRARGDERGAKALWTKLLSSAPDYPNKATLQAKANP